MLTETEVLQRIRGLKDPEIGRAFGELDMLRGVQISGDKVLVKIELPTPAYPGRDRISESVRTALSNAGAGTVDVEFSANVRGTMSGGAIGLRAKNVIAVGSGKGGVGKSTVAASL